MIRRVASFAVVVPDYDEAIAFYCGILGFELLEDTDLGGGNRWVRVRPLGDPGTSILLARAVTDEQRSRIGNQTGGRVFLFFATDDFDADHQRLVAQGVRVVRPPSKESYGTVAVFADPFGNLIDLIGS